MRFFSLEGMSVTCLYWFAFLMKVAMGFHTHTQAGKQKTKKV